MVGGVRGDDNVDVNEELEVQMRINVAAVVVVADEPILSI